MEDKKCHGMSRRDFIASLTKVVAGSLLFPRPSRAFSSPLSRVVHVYNPKATYWDFITGYYGHYVDQKEVDVMVDAGLMALTEAPTPQEAWRALIPNYRRGQKVAIKVNLNNAHSHQDEDQIIDALIQPVNSIIKGLKSLGAYEADIWIYDAKRHIPERFLSGCLYSGVQFFDSGGEGRRNFASFSDQYVNFSNPDNPPQPLPECLVDAHYLINMPILKAHASSGVSLSFKNHFGSIPTPGALHDFVFYYGADNPRYSADYSPLLDLYKSPHISGKTVLIVGDGLFGDSNRQDSEPEPWQTFGNSAPSSLFFSLDPVAIDSVMWDLLQAERPIAIPQSDDYLHLAHASGLGLHEHRDSAGQYHLIEYNKVETMPYPVMKLPTLSTVGKALLLGTIPYLFHKLRRKNP